jgi:hypothetical protein
MFVSAAAALAIVASFLSFRFSPAGADLMNLSTRSVTSLSALVRLSARYRRIGNKEPNECHQVNNCGVFRHGVGGLTGGKPSKGHTHESNHFFDRFHESQRQHNRDWNG